MVTTAQAVGAALRFGTTLTCQDDRPTMNDDRFRVSFVFHVWP
jgi:hypothetical protein